MLTVDFNKQTGIMSSTVAMPLLNESMDYNSSEIITSSNENTKSFRGISTNIPVSLIGNGISTGGINVTYVVGVTTQPGILNSSAETITNSGGSSSVSLAVGVTVPVVIIAAVAGLILMCVFKKRRKEKNRLNFELEFPDPSMVSKVHNAAFLTEMKGADVEDMDLQPTNIFMNQDIVINHDENFAAESEQAFNSQTNNTETVVVSFQEKKSCDKSRDGNVKVPSSEVGTITTEENRSLNNASGDLSKEKKAFELSEKAGSGYSLAKPVENDDRENDLSKKLEEPSKDEGVDDEVYIAMRARKDEVGNSEIQLSDTENSQDGMYTNVVVRRVQSMQATSKWKNGQEEHEQRRVMSETQGLSSRPPIAQPRVSKTKKFDPYDYVPSTQFKVDQLSTRSTDHDHEEERSDGDNCSDVRAEELYMDMSNTSNTVGGEPHEVPKINVY